VTTRTPPMDDKAFRFLVHWVYEVLDLGSAGVLL